jgi:hypothetical protein
VRLILILILNFYFNVALSAYLTLESLSKLPAEELERKNLSLSPRADWSDLDLHNAYGSSATFSKHIRVSWEDDAMGLCVWLSAISARDMRRVYIHERCFAHDTSPATSLKSIRAKPKSDFVSFREASELQVSNTRGRWNNHHRLAKPHQHTHSAGRALI